MHIRTGTYDLWKGLVVALLWLNLLPLAGQDQSFYAQHFHNRMVYNPSYAGDTEIPGIVLHSRQQWFGWEGAPSSNVLMAHSRLKDKNAGIGISLAFDRMGPLDYGGISGIYSYTVHLSGKYTLGMGLQAELRYRQLKLSQLQLVDQGDLLFSEDPGFTVSPNFGVGFHLDHEKYSVNISIPRLLNEKLSPFEGTSSQWSRFGRWLYFGADMKLSVSQEWTVIPSIQMAISKGRSPWIEVSGHMVYLEKIRAGLFYRYDRTFGAMVSYVIRGSLIFGYGYDISLGFPMVNPGTHEIYLGYNLPFNKLKTISPRQF
jgi:type IX secretion system PorP/SprF family membrane protein